MNFVYDPVQAAQLTYWVQYVSPVKGVRDELDQHRWRRGGACREPDPVPERGGRGPTQRLRVAARRGRRQPDRRVPEAHRGLTMADDRRRHRSQPPSRASACPTCCCCPGSCSSSCSSSCRSSRCSRSRCRTKPDRLRPEYDFTWEWDNFEQAFTRFGGHLVAGVRVRRCRNRAVHRDRLPDRLLHRVQGRRRTRTSCSAS